MSKNVKKLFSTHNINKIPQDNFHEAIVVSKLSAGNLAFINLITNNDKRNKFLSLLMEFFGSFLFVFLLLLPNILYLSPTGTTGIFIKAIQLMQNFLPLLALYNTFIIWLIFINARIHLDLKITSGGAISLHRRGNLDNKRTHQVLETIIFQLMGAFLASYCGYLILVTREMWILDVSTLGAIQSQMNGFIFTNNGMQNFGIVLWFLPLQITINLINILTVNHSQKEMRTFTNKTNITNNLKWLGVIYLISFIALEFNAQPISPNGIISNGIISFTLGGANNLFTMFAIVFSQYTLAICLLNNKTIRGNLN